jgi:glycosyltransferase involved in cell wall biosynthesis
MLSDREHDLTPVRTDPAIGAPVSSLRARYGLGNGHGIILYAGTFEPYQGLELLVDGSRRVLETRVDARFLCLGGTERQVDALKQRARQRGVAGAFLFPGTVPPEDVEAHFQIASVLVSPRVSGTNTPLKIYSYLRSGVPIVATNILSHTQVLTPDVGLLVEPTPEALASGILTVLDNPELGRRLVENAFRLARDMYSPQAYHAKVAEVFSFLASRSREPRTPASSLQG